MCDSLHEIPATAHGLVVSKTLWRTSPIIDSCTIHRIAADTSEVPIPSPNPYETTASTATKANPMPTFSHVKCVFWPALILPLLEWPQFKNWENYTRQTALVGSCRNQQWRTCQRNSDGTSAISHVIHGSLVDQMKPVFYRSHSSISPAGYESCYLQSDMILINS